MNPDSDEKLDHVKEEHPCCYWDYLDLACNHAEATNALFEYGLNIPFFALPYRYTYQGRRGWGLKWWQITISNGYNARPFKNFSMKKYKKEAREHIDSLWKRWEEYPDEVEQ